MTTTESDEITGWKWTMFAGFIPPSDALVQPNSGQSFRNRSFVSSASMCGT